jgi:hypothetical protein
MAASNPEIILRRLNEQLNAPLELTVIGRAALILGYDPPILGENAGQTFDVDLVIPRDQEEALDRNDAFWSALERTNNLLSTADLYLSHIFLENQIILGENWKDRRVRMVLAGANNLILFRPSSLDLLLSKMARADDPIDRADILQLIRREHFPQQRIEAAFSTARCPSEPDLIEQFEKAKSFVRSFYQSGLGS